MPLYQNDPPPDGGDATVVVTDPDGTSEPSDPSPGYIIEET